MEELMRHNSVLKNKLFALALGLAFVLPMVAPTWAKDEKGALSPAAKAGQKVFATNCSVCHLDTQTTTKIGPGLKGLFKGKELPYSHKPVTEANVREQIEKGNAEAKPTPMPPFGTMLSKTDIDNVIAYLKTL
jgi:mono/diheme cytochrome c family protein